MNKKIVIIIILMLFSSTSISMVGASKNDTLSAITKSSNGSWISSRTTQSTLGDWFHYDDGSCENSLGLTAGGTLYEVIKLTPEELSPYGHQEFGAIKVMHGCPDYPGCPETPFTAWIYYGANHPNNPETDATIITTGICPAIDNYFYINFTETPYAFNATDTVWLGVGWQHPAGAYPCGFDTDSCIAGKSDFLWFPGGQWYELGQIGYPGNWNFEVLIDCFDGYDRTPPTTTCTVSGTNPVTITFTAEDPDDPVAATFYELDGTDYTQYTTPVQVTTPGAHTVMFYSIDSHENQEVPKSQNFTVARPPTITIKGGLGITIKIHNDGVADVAVDGTVTVTGLVFPKSKVVSGTVPAGKDLNVKDIVFGFGPTTITVNIGDQTVKKNATVILILVF